MHRPSLFFPVALCLSAALHAQTTSAAEGPYVAKAPILPQTTSASMAKPDEELQTAAMHFEVAQAEGRTLAKAVRKVLKLDWHEDLTRAAKAARAQDKPLVWIQLLGDLDGRT